MTILWRLVSSLLPLMLVGCYGSASIFQTPEMSHSALPLAERMRVELWLNEPRLCLQTRIDSAMNYGGGLIGSIISDVVQNTRARSAERSVAALRDAWGDLPIEAVTRAALTSKIDRQVFAADLDIVAVPLDAQGLPTQALLSPASRVLVLVPTFCFDPDANVLKVSMGVTVQNRFSIDGKPRKKPQFVSFVEFGYDDPGIRAKENRDERMEMWSTMINRSQALTLLEQAMNGAVAELNETVRTRNETAQGIGKSRYPGLGGWLSALVLRESDGRRWMRLATVGYLVSVGPLPPM